MVAAGRNDSGLRIGQGLALEIRRGRLRPGERLPGSRRLAESLGWRRRHRLADTLQEMLRLAAREAQFESGYSS